MKQVFFFLCLITSLVATSSKEEASYAVGNLIGNDLQKSGIELNLDKVISGIKDRLLNKSNISEDEAMTTFSVYLEVLEKAQQEKNLQLANSILEKNKTNSKIVILEKGKLQYLIDKSGQGPAVNTYNNPIIRYIAKYPDGSIFQDCKEGKLICLNEAPDGLKKGLIGMKEHEKRTIYIHPDLNEETHNSLITYEVEILKVDAKSPIPQENLISQDKSLR